MDCFNCIVLAAACRNADEQVAALTTNKVTFEVCAGKEEYDSAGNYERNYKYGELFDDYALALAAYDSCAGYAFRELSVVQFNTYTTIKE